MSEAFDVQRFVQSFPVLARAEGSVEQLRALVLSIATTGLLTRAASHPDGVGDAGWKKTTLDRLGKWGSGGTPSRSNPSNYDGDIPWLKISDLNDGLVTVAEERITQAALEGSSAKLIPKGAVLIAMYGSIGKLGLTGISCSTNQAIAHCIPDESIVSARYLMLLLRASRKPLIYQGKGMAQQNISQTVLKAFEVLVPPLEEQQRIVAKVDELMALIDDLDAQQTKEREVQIRFRSSALDALAKAEGPEDLAAAWNRVAGNFEVVFERAESVSAAREAIIDLAITGKLSAPNTEWRQVRLGDVASIRTGFAFKSPEYAPHGTFVLRVTNIRPDGRVTKAVEAVFFPTEKINEKLSAHLLRAGELLVVMVGGSLGKVGVVTDDVLPALLNQNMWRVNARREVLSQRYLRYLLFYLNRRKARVTHSTHGHLAMSEYVQETLALPSLEEQERLVQTIERVLSLCDGLGDSLKTRDATAAKLVDAVVRELVA